MKSPNWREWIKNQKECRLWLENYKGKKILKKSKDQSNLYLRKTDHNLNFANWIMEKHENEIPEVFEKETFYDWVVSVYYYAIYHSALALITTKGYISKNHSATLCFIIYHYYH